MVSTTTQQLAEEAADANQSIFAEYYGTLELEDRYLSRPEGAIDVIIPVIHTNELWRANLVSVYREVPVHKLLIGDGGCVDGSIDTVRAFPRVEVLDHRAYRSLGYSIRKLIEAVETEWFIYIHSDVYLPRGWFDRMQAHQTEYDWFGCSMVHTVLVEYSTVEKLRPWAGSQMGRKAAFGGLDRIDDDFVYRQEDFVFADIVARNGFKEGRVDDTFHYHQTMRKPSPWERKVKGLQIDVEMSREEEVRTWNMQVRGIIKYLAPVSAWLVDDVNAGIRRLLELGELDWPEFLRWVRSTNPGWLNHIARKRPFRTRLRAFLRASHHLVFG